MKMVYQLYTGEIEVQMKQALLISCGSQRSKVNLNES